MPVAVVFAAVALVGCGPRPPVGVPVAEYVADPAATTGSAAAPSSDRAGTATPGRSPSGPPGRSPGGSPFRATVEQADGMLVAAGSLPGVFQLDPLVDQSTPTDLPPGCPALDRFELALGQAQVRAARGFLGGPLGPFLAERVAVLPATAADEMDALARASVRCRTFTARDADGGSVRFGVTRLPDPELGDQSLALALTGKAGDTGLLRHDLTVLRRGDTLVVFVFSGHGLLDPLVLPAGSAAVLAAIEAF
ncbi:MAG: hypothetical protein HYR62_01475 [Actinobacteria bacterium]|nr:hypothetical protein [Actinomycetota bacterium]MBI3688846.1 hypothetical protein [Actinomycetota bacterium]